MYVTRLVRISLLIGATEILKQGQSVMKHIGSHRMYRDDLYKGDGVAVKWVAMGPISVALGGEDLVYDSLRINRIELPFHGPLLKEIDLDHWPKADLMSLSLEGLSWIELYFDADPREDVWWKGLQKVIRILQAFGLYKTSPARLTVGGLMVKTLGEERERSSFGHPDTIVGKPYYFLKEEEYSPFLDLLSRWEKFWQQNENFSNELLRRIELVLTFFTKCLESDSLVDQHIFLSIVLESLYGPSHSELEYRYANRAAILLGDDILARKRACDTVRLAYKKRSEILHGRFEGQISLQEVLNFQEIVRQSVLRYMSLYAPTSKEDIGKTLDDCLHSPEDHTSLLKNATKYFGSHSEHNEPQEYSGRALNPRRIPTKS